MHKPVTRISTRGYYDLSNGSTLKKNPYHFYPKKELEKLVGSKELVIMIHGLRNDNAGAVQKTLLAKNRLKQLGYSYPVIGYSYRITSYNVCYTKLLRNRFPHLSQGLIHLHYFPPFDPLGISQTD